VPKTKRSLATNNNNKPMLIAVTFAKGSWRLLGLMVVFSDHAASVCNETAAFTAAHFQPAQSSHKSERAKCFNTSNHMVESGPTKLAKTPLLGCSGPKGTSSSSSDISAKKHPWAKFHCNSCLQCSQERLINTNNNSSHHDKLAASWISPTVAWEPKNREALSLLSLHSGRTRTTVLYLAYGRPCLLTNGS
jgi:hypothetical protein